jgi:hypothetical protein
MKKTVPTILLLVFAIVAVSSQLSAQEKPKPKDPLVGSWVCEDDGTKVQIRDNGTLTINGEEYAYKVKGANITLVGDDGSAVLPFALDGDTLTVEYEGREIVYTRAKGGLKSLGGGGAAAPPREGIIPEFVGTWCYMSSLTGSNSYMSSRCFTLYANGTYEFKSESSTSGGYGSTAGQGYDSGRWTATRNSITAVSNTNGRTVYPIELRNHPKTGDPMIVVDGDAYVTSTQRAPW